MSTQISELHSLSQLVLEVLDAQKKYFKTRDKDDLIASKQLEKRLRDKASSYLPENVIDPKGLL